MEPVGSASSTPRGPPSLAVPAPPRESSVWNEFFSTIDAETKKARESCQGGSCEDDLAAHGMGPGDGEADEAIDVDGDDELDDGSTGGGSQSPIAEGQDGQPDTATKTGPEPGVATPLGTSR